MIYLMLTDFNMDFFYIQFYCNVYEIKLDADALSMRKYFEILENKTIYGFKETVQDNDAIIMQENKPEEFKNSVTMMYNRG